jgi:hypothetical protein
MPTSLDIILLHETNLASFPKSFADVRAFPTQNFFFLYLSIFKLSFFLSPSLLFFLLYIFVTSLLFVFAFHTYVLHSFIF